MRRVILTLAAVSALVLSSCCLDTHKYVSRVQQETQRGVQLGVKGTPTLFVNGQRVGLTTSRDPVETIRLAVQNARPH